MISEVWSMAEEKRSIGYLCPVCGKSVIVERTTFQLAAGNNVLPCPCGKSELTIEQLGDRCEIAVPCVFCAKDHHTACSNDVLLRQKLAALSCSASNLGICYIGQSEQVFEAMEKLETAVDKLCMDDQMETRGVFLDEIVMGEVLEELKEIAGRGGIQCACGKSDYGIKVGYSAVDVVCAHCGGVLRVDATTPDDIDAICSKYTLTIPCRKDG